MRGSNNEDYTHGSSNDDSDYTDTSTSFPDINTRHHHQTTDASSGSNARHDQSTNPPSSLQPISFDPSNIVLILTVDGTLHALDTFNRSFVWHTSIDPILVTTTDDAHGDMEAPKLRPVIVLGNPRSRRTHSGTLLYYTREEREADQQREAFVAFDVGPMMRVQHLVTHSPIHFPGAQQILLGRRTGRLVSLNMMTGMKQSKEGPDRLVLGRTDYELRAVDEGNHLLTHWSLSYAELDGIKQPTQPAGEEEEGKYVMGGNILTVNQEWAVRFAETPVQVMRVVRREGGGGEYYTVQLIDTGTGGDEIGRVWIRRDASHAIYALIKDDKQDAWPQDNKDDPPSASASFDEFKVQRAELPFELNSFELDYWQPWIRLDDRQPQRDLLLLPAPPEHAPPYHQWISTLSVLLVSAVMMVQVWRRWRHRQLCSQSKSREFVPIELVDTQWIPPAVLAHSTIAVNPNRILGYGSNGCIVMEGRYHNRACAIKRLPNATKRLDREIAELQRVDRHEHVRRLYGHQQVGGYTYMALELADASLESVMAGGTGTPPLDPLSVCLQLVRGVRHLHEHGLVHRDLKPTNVLLIGERVVVSDLGIALRVEGGGQLTVSTGTPGWRAPESGSEAGKGEQGERVSELSLLMDNKIEGKSGEESVSLPDASSDIFSLGCLIYYVCSGGEHPFGSVMDRERNALNGSLLLKRCERLSMEDNNLLFTLVTRMTDLEAKRRPSIGEVNANPLFWNASLRLGFLMDLSDWMEQQDRYESLPGILELKCVRQGGALSAGLVNTPDDASRDWLEIVDKIIWSDLTKYRSYSGRSLVDLMRAIRNKRHHFNELPFFAKRMLGKDGSDQGYWGYFAERFPRVLGVVYEAAREWGLFEREGKRFAKYHWLGT